MSDQDKSFIATMMHLVKGVGCVLKPEGKVVACSLSQLRKRELNYLACYLELSIVKHGSNIFLEVKVTYRRIIRVYRTSSLRLS